MNYNSVENPQSGASCIKASYNDKEGKGGVVWTSPENDRGDKPGGYDFTGASKVTFWAAAKRAAKR